MNSYEYKFSCVRFACFIYDGCNSDFNEKASISFTTGLMIVCWDIMIVYRIDTHWYYYCNYMAQHFK